jgi:hypothetical protein
MRVAVALIASCAIAGCGSCKDKPAAKKADPRSATIPTGPAKPGGLQVRKPNWAPPATAGSGSATPVTPKALVTTLTLAEATPIIPTISDTTIVDAPTEAPQGAQVHFAWCTTAADAKAAQAVIESSLTAAGWGEFHDRGMGARIAISADKPPYRISASISASPRPGCSPADGKWFSSVQLYKLQAVAHPPIDDVK